MDGIIDDPQKRAMLKRRMEKVLAFLVAQSPRINALDGVLLQALPLCDRVILTDRERQLIILNGRFGLSQTHKLLSDTLNELLPLMTMLLDEPGYSVTEDFHVEDPEGNIIERYQPPV